MKFFAKITGKIFDQIPSKIKEFVTKVWENLSVDDYRSDDGQGSREDSLRKPENEASADERNSEERDVKNDNDDNDGVDVGASCANETKVGENNENDECKQNGGTEAASTFCEEFGKQLCFYENPPLRWQFLNDTLNNPLLSLVYTYRQSYHF